MNSIYTQHLPRAFPVGLTVPDEVALKVIEKIITDDTYPNGSSFAVTSDAAHHYKNLWLSRASYDIVKDYLNGGD